MQRFVDELVQLKQDRSRALTTLTEHTQHALTEARGLMQRLRQEQHGRVSALHDRLDDDRKQRAAQIQALQQQQQQQRQQRRERFLQMRKELTEALTASRDEVQRQVSEFRTTFRTARHQLAGDLRQAGQRWRQRHRRTATG
jgi:hypothetical protein